MGFGISGGVIKIENQKELPTLRNPGKPNARQGMIITKTVI